MAGRRASPLRALEQVRAEYGRGAARRKLELLAALGHARLARASDVLKLHEGLCFLRAYPDNRAVLSRVERLLQRFDRRPDLRHHARALASSGVAGTPIRFRFFEPTARWLAERWPQHLVVDWREFENLERLEGLLPLLALPAETPGLDEIDLPVREWIQRMKGREETDATFLVRRLAALPLDPFAREILYDELDPPLVLAPGPGTPSRTRARHRPLPVVFQRRPLDRSRPELKAALRRPPRSIRPVPPREGQALIELARGAMITRERDLDAFSYGDRHDVRLADCGGGLQFAVIGVIPERRLMLESVYAYLTLKNGVPIGYVLVSALYRSSEIAYNVFETWRGGEAGQVYGQALATTRALFGSDTFTIFPYQLGEGNTEGLRSGAWWFYRKLGFLPRDPGAVRHMHRELRRVKADPSHRSSLATLRRLAAHNLYYSAGPPRDDVIGRLDLPNVGLHVTRFLAERFGSGRARAVEECSREAMRVLGLESLAGFSPGERLAWERWAPLVLVLPEVSRWTPAGRRALIEVVRAKGGMRESDFVQRFDRHRRLREALRLLAGRPVRAPRAPRRSAATDRTTRGFQAELTPRP